MKNKISRSAFILILIHSILLPLFADIPEYNDQVKEIAHNLRCPVCQGLSVKESNTEISLNMKNKIQEMLDDNKSVEEVYDYFQTSYGEWIFREPRKIGFNQFLWLLPYFFFFFGTAFFLILVWRLRKRNAHYSRLEKPAIKLSADDEKEINEIMTSYKK